MNQYWKLYFDWEEKDWLQFFDTISIIPFFLQESVLTTSARNTSHQEPLVSTSQLDKQNQSSTSSLANYLSPEESVIYRTTLEPPQYGECTPQNQGAPQLKQILMFIILNITTTFDRVLSPSE
jgi:hypothetical protein